MADKEMQYFRSFRNICRNVHATLNLKEVLDLITENVVQILDVKACNILLLNRGLQRLEVSNSYGLSSVYLTKGPLDADKSIAESLEGKPVLIYDVTKDSRIQYPEEAKRERIASILSVPITVKQKVIGVLRIYTSQPRSFSEDEIEFVTGLAEMGGIAIVNARLYEQLKEDSRTMMSDTWHWFESMLPRPTC